jgi:glycerophosphoryl diester phosphodiesterase
VRYVRRALWIVVPLALVYLYFATLHPLLHVSDHAYFDKRGPWVIAHRGGRGLWPENTLFAMEKAQALGVDVLEMDLRATSDGAIVVIHDRTVNRTTNGEGRVDNLTLAEIRALDAGYRFRDASGEFPYRNKGVVIPTIDEVLARFPTARLNVEMKDTSPQFAASLCAILQRNGGTRRVMIASFNHAAITAFRDACPEVATSASMREAITVYQLSRMGLASLYRGPAVALQIPEAFGRWRFIEPWVLDLAAALNVRLEVWTVNEEADMQRLLKMGVHGILTDYPDRLLGLMGRGSATRNARAVSGR